MWSGLDTLDKIDGVLHSLRSEAIKADQQLAQVTQRHAAVEQRRMHIVYQIAKVRLASIDSGELDARLNTADREVKDVLSQRVLALNLLNQQIEQMAATVQSQEGARLAQLNKVNELTQQIADLEATVQAQLLKDAAYLEQLNRATVADSVAAESKAKVAVAQADMAAKALPYKSDELFIYLWSRGYGTTEYRASLIARWLDAWVAKLIRYEAARVNYWNLTQIPMRLQQHAENVALKAESEAQAVQQIERERIDTAGVNALGTQLQTLQAELDRRDDELETAESELNELLAQRAQFTGGDDAYTKACLSRLAQAMDQRDLDAVYRYVLATSSLSDDELVVELSDLDQQSHRVKAELQDFQKLRQAQLHKLQEIEAVRRNFKNARFDDVRSGFSNHDLLSTALGQFVQGALNGSDLWGVIKRNQHYDHAGQQPGFGSDGLHRTRGGTRRAAGVPPTNGSWHWPQPRVRGSAPAPKSSGKFKTGGSF